MDHPINGNAVSNTNNKPIAIASSNTEKNDWDPQAPTIADNASIHSSATSQASSHSQQGLNSLNDEQTNQAGTEKPGVTGIEGLVDELSKGINKVAAELSRGLSVDKDTKEGRDNLSNKSDSSLDSNMAAKLAQANLVPPDVIAIGYVVYTFNCS